MGMAATKFTQEVSVEDRLARLETHTEHIQSDIADIKIDLRRLDDKIGRVDEKLTAKFDAVDQRLTAKFDAVESKIEAVDLRLTDKIEQLIQGVADLKSGKWETRAWWLVTLAAVLGVMARGFKWI
jgi:predicted  nucleic acid-binding Zn-ribbon protein